MNYRILTSIFCSFITTSVLAQSESSDSIMAQELDEVVVEARTQRVIERGVEYVPAKKVKKAAIDATQLLRLMNIPQLDIMPGSMAVKTYSGQAVGMFIDFKEASEEDLRGLRPEDVLKVEVLQYPQDPRFGGQANVVNFIMRKYDWGGYTKLTADGNTLNYDKGDGILYTKYVKGKWTLDANATGSITHNDKFHGRYTETFRDISVGDRRFDEISRTTESGINYLKQNNSQAVSLRSSYDTDKTQITHTVSYIRVGNPLTRDVSKVDFSEDVFSASSTLSQESGQTISPRARGFYYFALPKDNLLIASWNFSYGSTRRFSSYRLGNMTPIVNNNRETSYEPVLRVNYSKKFSHNNTIRTSLFSYNTIYHTHYEGSYNGLQKLLSSENMLFLEYMQDWKCGLSLYSRLGVSYVLGRLHGVNTLKQWNPRLGLQLQYQINDRHSASVEGWWGNNHPTPESSNSAMVQSNELLWLQGNPGLRNTTFLTAIASYTYVPNNKLNLSATAEYYGYLKKTAFDFFSMPGHDGLIRKVINSGDFHNISGYVAATLKLFDNSLSLRASGQVKRMIASGIDAQSMNVVMANIQANYYFRNFSFSLYYRTPQKDLGPFHNGIRYRYKSTYGFLMNYSTGNFKAGLQLDNWFDSYRYYYDLDSQRYSFHGWQWEGELARSLKLTLSYTFPYGKQIKRNNEVQTSSQTNSAILK